MNRRRVIGGVAAVSLAGLGAVGLASWATDTKASAEDQQAQTAVIIVDEHVPKGADAATILAGTHEGTVQRKSLARGRRHQRCPDRQAGRRRRSLPR